MQHQKKGEWSKLASIDLTESWKVIISSIWNTFIDSVHVTYPVPHTQHGPRGPSTGIQGQETLVHGKEPRNVEGFHHYLKTRFFLAESVLNKTFLLLLNVCSVTYWGALLLSVTVCISPVTSFLCFQPDLEWRLLSEQVCPLTWYAGPDHTYISRFVPCRPS